MNKQIEQVSDFHRSIGELVATEPRLLECDPQRDCELAHSLRQIVKSFNEKQETRSHLARRAVMAVEELAEWIEAHAEGDLVSAADALGDRLYVLLGDAVATGLPAGEIFDEVHRSNMTKKQLNLTSGKGVKKEDFIRPDLELLLLREKV